MRSLFHFLSARQKIYLIRLAIFWNHQNTSKSWLHFWPQVRGDSLWFPPFNLKFPILVYSCIVWRDYSSIPTCILKHVPFLPAFWGQIWCSDWLWNAWAQSTHMQIFGASRVYSALGDLTSLEIRLVGNPKFL